MGHSPIIRPLPTAVNSTRSDGERRYARRWRARTAPFVGGQRGMTGRSVCGGWRGDAIEVERGVVEGELLLGRPPGAAAGGVAGGDARALEDLCGDGVLLVHR